MRAWVVVSQIEAIPKVRDVGDFLIMRLENVIFDGGEKTIRELQRWKGIDKLLNLSHTSTTFPRSRTSHFPWSPKRKTQL